MQLRSFLPNRSTGTMQAEMKSERGLGYTNDRHTSQWLLGPEYECDELLGTNVLQLNGIQLMF